MKTVKLLLLSLCVVSIQFTFAQEDVHYIENKGQFPDQVDFKADLQDGAVFVEGNELTFAFRNVDDMTHLHDHHHDAEQLDLSTTHDINIGMHAYKTQFINANTSVSPITEDKQSGIYNYFIGNDKSKWANNVHRYGSITYPNLYNGIDLKLYSSEDNFKYDFIVQPKADPSVIQFNYDGLDGVSIKDGNLILSTSIGEMIEQSPYVYQIIKGSTIQVECEYQLINGVVSFKIGEYSKKHALIIDPVLIAATYSGSSVTNYGHSACFDNNGNIFTGARSFGVGYPTSVGAYQVNFGGGGVDIAVSKLNPDGSALIYATYLGGTNNEYPHSMVTNNNGELFVFGSTSSTDYPVSAGAYDNTLGGTQDMVISHLSTDGSILIGSTLIGGNANDGSNSVTLNYGDGFRGEIIVDQNDDCFIVSSSQSTDFPISAGAYQSTLTGASDAVVFSLNSDMTVLNWSTFIGGTSDEAGFGLRLDANGDIYACGATNGDIPAITGYQTTNQGGTDGFIVHIGNNGTQLLNGSLWGTTANDNTFFLDLNANGDVVFYGQTQGTIPVTTGAYTDAGSSQYIANLSADLSTVGFSTMIGATNFVPIAFMVDNCGYIYFCGHSAGGGAPTTSGAIQTTGGFYVGVLESGATGLYYGTYYGGGGDHVDGGTSRFDPSGVVYQGVCTGGGFNATPNALANSGSGWDIAVFKIDFEVPLSALQISVEDFTVCDLPPYDVPFSCSAAPNGVYQWDFGDGGTSTLQNPLHQYTGVGQYDIQLIVIDSTGCSIVDTAYASVTIVEPETFDANWNLLPPPPCSNEVLLDATFTGSGADSLVWLSNGTVLSNQAQVTELFDVAGTYTVSLIVFDFDCSQVDTLSQTFTVEEFPQVDLDITVNDITACGIPPYDVPFTSTASPNAIYNWDFGDGNSSTLQNPNHLYMAAGQYNLQLIVIDSSVCMVVDTAYATITIIEPEVFDAEWDILPPPPCSNEILLDVSFTGTGADSIIWDLNGTILTNQMQVTQLYNIPGTYTVSLIAYDFDCSEIDTLTEIFTVSENSDYGEIEMPNVFTPNKDQTNDVYKPKYVSNNYEDVFDNLESYDILITNRWGHEIFHSGQTQSEWSWDGMIKGEPATEGIYFYIVMYQPFCTELEEGEDPLIKQHGFIHLISE